MQLQLTYDKVCTMSFSLQTNGFNITKALPIINLFVQLLKYPLEKRNTSRETSE